MNYVQNSIFIFVVDILCNVFTFFVRIEYPDDLLWVGIFLLSQSKDVSIRTCKKKKKESALGKILEKVSALFKKKKLIRFA